MESCLSDFANMDIFLERGGGIYRLDMVQGFDTFRILYTGQEGTPGLRAKIHELHANKQWFKEIELIHIMLQDGCWRWVMKNGNFAKECIGDRRNGHNIEREIVNENGQLIFRYFHKDRQKDISTFTRKQ